MDQDWINSLDRYKRYREARDTYRSHDAENIIRQYGHMMEFRHVFMSSSSETDPGWDHIIDFMSPHEMFELQHKNLNPSALQKIASRIAPSQAGFFNILARSPTAIVTLIRHPLEMYKDAVSVFADSMWSSCCPEYNFDTLIRASFTMSADKATNLILGFKTRHELNVVQKCHLNVAQRYHGIEADRLIDFKVDIR